MFSQTAFDALIIGGGLVGLSLARQLLEKIQASK
jgi:L-2-hydroxyglutarate oxidase LhgO